MSFTVLAGGAARRLLDLLVVERLERHLALDELLLQHLTERLEPILGGGVQLDLSLSELDRAVGPLEVEAVGHLACCLVDSVADLLPIDLRDDVEAGHGGMVTLTDILARPWVGARVAKGNWL